MDRKKLLIGLLFLALFLVPGLRHGLWLPDEPRVAGICSEMVRTGDYIVPHLNGRAFLEKPPLYFAVAALFGSLVDTDSEVPYRLASLLFSVLTILLTFGMTNTRHGVIAGLMAGGILASSWEFFKISRWILVDSALVFGVTLSMYAYLELQEHSSVKKAVLFGAGVGLSFLAKGFVGPAMICAAICADMIRTGEIRILWRLRPFPVLLVVVSLIGAWMVFLFAEGGWSYVHQAIVVNNIMRFTGAPEGAALGHQHGMLYYLDRFPRGILPWTFLFIPAILSAGRHYRDNPYLSWVVGPLVLLSLASTKRGIYLVPLYPAVAAVIACWLNTSPCKKWESVMIRITGAIAVAGCFLPFAGIFLGKSLIGLSAGIVSVTALFVLQRNTGLKRPLFTPPRLVLVMYVGLIASTTVYFTVMEPREDFLRFTREALALAGDREVSIVVDDELFEGVVPMVTQGLCRAVDPSGGLPDGLYLLANRHDDTSLIPTKSAGVTVLFERRIGSRRAFLAEVNAHCPDTLSGKE